MSLCTPENSAIQKLSIIIINSCIYDQSTSPESGGGDTEITANNQTENNETDEPDQNGDGEREENDWEANEMFEYESIAGSPVLVSDLSPVDIHSCQAVANPSSASSQPSEESLSELSFPQPTSANVAGVWGHEATSTVEIGRVRRETTIETLTYYFENNTRSGGGPLQRIRQDHTTGRCYATFEDAESECFLIIFWGCQFTFIN